jgi:hypothetical protein
MWQRVFFYISILLTLPATLFAQIPLTGQAIDMATRQPISRANVQLLQPETTAVLAFAIADQEGKFRLKPQEPGRYLLKVTAMGYLPEEKYIDLSEQKNEFFVELSTDKARVLKEIIIPGYPPSTFKIRGDTIFYNIDAVRDGTEKNLGEALKKLPGISVDENGKVSYQGKPIRKIMVESNDFFGNKHQMATQNLSADMVKEVELHTKYKESNLDNSSNGIVMNVLLKDEFKGRPTGNLSTGAGNRYTAHSNLFMFGSGGNKALISDFNNTGELPITQQDYYEMRGGILNVIESQANDALQPTTSQISSPRFLLSNTNLETKNSQFSALNFTRRYNKKTKLDIYGYVNRVGQTDRNSRTENFIGNNISFNEQFRNRTAVLFGSVMLNLTHEPNDDNYLKYSFTYNPSGDRMEESLVNNRAEGALDVQTRLRNRNFSIGQQATYIRRLSPRWIWKSRALQHYATNDQLLAIRSTAPFLGLSFPAGDFSVEQPLQTRDQFYSLRSELSRKQNTRHFVSFFAGFEHKNQQLENRWAVVENEPRNNLRLANSLYKGGIQTMQALGRVAELKFTAQALYLDHRLDAGAATAATTNNGRWLFEPDIELSKQVGESQLALQWKVSHRYAVAEQLLTHPFIRDYRTFRQNGEIVGSIPTRSENLNFSWRRMNILKGSMFFANVMYIRTVNEIINVSESIDRNTVVLRTLFAPFSEAIQAFANYDHKLRRLPLGIKNNTSVSYREGDNFEGSNPSRFITRMLNYRGSIYTLFKEPVFQAELGFGFSMTRSYYAFSDRLNTFSSWQPYTKFRGKYGQLVWELMLEYRYQNAQTNSNEIFFINPSLRYTPKGKRHEWFISGNNIANMGKNQIVTAIFTNNSITVSERAILSGYLLGGFKFGF